MLVDRGGRLAHTRDLHDVGVGQHGVHGALDAWRNRGREQKRLADLGACLHDAADAGPKAHVEHAVRLVQDEDLNVAEVDVVVFHEVDETSRRGHEQVAAGVERADLAVELGAAHDHDGGLAGLGTDLLRDILDLRGELARGSDDEGKGAARLGNLLAVGDALQRG